MNKYRVNNIKFNQKKESKQCDHTDANKEDQVYWLSDLLDYLDRISLIPDLYNNNHNQDLENCYDDHYRVHSEPINIVPSMIPNNGERVVLLSLVPRVMMNVILNKILLVVFLTFLQIKFEWILKKYPVDNDSKMEWTLKKYQVDNDSKMDWVLKWYQVDNDSETAFNEQSEGSKATFQVVRNNNLFSDYDDGIKTVSIMKRKILVRRLGSDMNESLPRPKLSLKKLTPASKSTTSPRKKVSSNQDPLKRAHLAECCFIMKNKDGECHMKAKFHTPDPLDYLNCICLNPDPLTRTHSPQGMLSLIDRTGYSVMKRKDGEFPDPKVKLYYQGAYQLYPRQPVGEMDYLWEDNESMINSPTVPEAKLHKKYSILSFHYVRSIISRGYIINTAAFFLNNILEVDVSIAEGSIFGILGSEKRSEKPMNGMHVHGQTIFETSIYTTVRRLLLVQ